MASHASEFRQIVQVDAERRHGDRRIVPTQADMALTLVNAMREFQRDYQLCELRRAAGLDDDHELDRLEWKVIDGRKLLQAMLISAGLNPAVIGGGC